jgi:small ligand-binding sensory domain FIST
VTRVGAGISSAPDAASAAAEAARDVLRELAGPPIDLAFVFLSQHHLDDAPAAAAIVAEELAPRRLVGCVAQGVVGRDRELEEGPGVAVWAASLPGVEIETFHVAPDEEGELELPSLANADLVALLVDPFSFPATQFLEALNDEYPGLPVVGGLAMGGEQSGAQALLLDGEVYDRGAVGAVIAGANVRAVVSQGCAPIGHDSVITHAEENVVFELAGQPALERLREELAALPPTQQALVSRGLLAGLVIDENKPEYARGDFLIRSLIGIDDESGALAVGETPRVGQTLRFHVRDAESADTDLRESLAAALEGTRGAGALLFTCNGRGVGMFGEESHDARVVAGSVAGDAVAGFFCGGEIGPVGGRTFLHGFTATMALFLDG